MLSSLLFMDDVQTNPNPSVADSDAPVVSSPAEFMADFLLRLQSESEKNQLKLVQELANKGESGLEVLMKWLLERRNASLVGIVDGKAHQLLVAADTPKTQEFLATHLDEGLIALRSPRDIDYSALAHHLVRQEYQEADRLTLEKLCELAGEMATQRRWVYFTEVDQLPSDDLQLINRLWQLYSEGRFGFSVQRELWLGAGKNWERLWGIIGWKSGNTWTRYPNEFTWDMTAPRGHLPLSNQLRGVRAISSLLNHPAWTRQD